MKPFNEYKDGEWVVYRNPKSEWHNMQFQAYKSKYTDNAFRLKYGTREVVVDIAEIGPISELNKFLQEDDNEKFNSNLQRNSKSTRDQEVDQLPSGLYQIQD